MNLSSFRTEFIQQIEKSKLEQLEKMNDLEVQVSALKQVHHNESGRQMWKIAIFTLIGSVLTGLLVALLTAWLMTP